MKHDGLNRSILVLASGGIDSSCCLAYYLADTQNTVSALFIDYGQAAAQFELAAVKKICRFYEISLSTVIVKGFGTFGNGIINGRNAFLLLTALTFNPFPAGLFSIGIHSGTDYPDCTQQFANQIQSVFDTYSDGRISVDTPFINFTKQDIWNLAKKLEVPVELTYSCEAGIWPRCNKCLSCMDLVRVNGEAQK